MPSYRFQNELDDRIYATSQDRIRHEKDHYVRQIDSRWTRDTSTAPFIGVAISGGGSRAANFGAAVLQYLDELGILQHVTAISSVSGGSLAAAYYVLKRPHSTSEWSEFRERMRTNFIEEWARRIFLSPANWLRFLLTDYSRTDVLASVFDDKLFGRAKFSQLTNDSPRLFINATSLSQGGEQVTFTNQYFSFLKSRSDSYPISYGVTASGVFPGVFP